MLVDPMYLNIFFLRCLKVKEVQKNTWPMCCPDFPHYWNFVVGYACGSNVSWYHLFEMFDSHRRVRKNTGPMCCQDFKHNWNHVTGYACGANLPWNYLLEVLDSQRSTKNTCPICCQDFASYWKSFVAMFVESVYLEITTLRCLIVKDVKKKILGPWFAQILHATESLLWALLVEQTYLEIIFWKCLIVKELQKTLCPCLS